MSFNKVSFEGSLAKSVVAAGKCLGCGVCVVTCPFNCLEYKEGKPVLINECNVCGICAQACPTYEWSWSELENFVFGRERKTEEEFGVYRRLVVARAMDDRILETCQDGGVVTALLLFALENGLIDSAVVSGISQEKPLYPIPKLAMTPEEILECAGTRYSYSPSILALTEAIKQRKTSIAFVGTPCQIRAIRKMQMLGLKKYTRPLKFLIGLMCSECFTYEGLIEKYIHRTLGLNLNAIRKMNIKGRILIRTKSEVKTIPLAEAKQYAQKSCRFCKDFSSELADISVGGLGLEGWTFVVIRTNKGQEVFEEAEKAGVLEIRSAEKNEFALSLLVKLSRKKRESADR
ncbi:MAG: Coenzyme F420 hydrogenase/dehydrogenase, beta subunit C-terminal domain [Candidatus Bathyarchaeota archaeon]|nr:Coenzyme F420 hydrogenase/dehydrogenase, beta subunit C-terminal domain [Candidatus Bathyarchaeota archaeon]MDH5746510.1 Coenzyme F420 hydrogenase/dehydrogenase, beta subunit C-terminal domain [Candidatus Bathyarchaeota archaeon]